MADPISVISLIEGSIGLVVQCGSVAKTLSDIIAKFKHAEVAIMSLKQEVETIQFAWDRIKKWSEDHAEAATDSQFVQRLEKSLQCGTLVLSALEQELADYKHTADNASFKLRSKMAWNERAFLDHQHRVRGQVQAMTLILQVSQLPTSKAQTKLLKNKEKAFRASDESAYSIVPSRMSSHMSASTRSRDSILTIESQELVYYPLSFEDDLFTARVYKRNYRNPWINSLVKFHWSKKREERRVSTANPEASKDGQSLLSSSTRMTTPKALSVDLLRPWPSNPDIHLQDLRPVSPSPAFIAEKKADPTNLERSVMISGSIPSTFEDSPSISSGLQNGAMDPSIKPMYTTEWQPDISDAISPAPGYTPQIDSVSRLAVARPSLLRAVNDGNLDEVKTLIIRGAPINPRPVINMPPLHFAICKNNVSMTKLLLQEGADCTEGWSGTPPIHQACNDSNFQITQLLLDAGASASSLDVDKEQPLHRVLSGRFLRFDASDLIDLLISRGADINARTHTNETPLHLSCKYPNVDNVRRFLVHGANMSAQDWLGNTPFHISVTAWLNGEEDPECCDSIIQLLVEHGVNVNAQNGAGDTPFHTLVAICRWKFSIRERCEAAIQLLLEHGVNVNAQNKVGDTPLHIVARCDYSVENNAEWRIQLIRWLIDAGADLSVKNISDETPRTHGILSGKPFTRHCRNTHNNPRPQLRRTRSH